MNHYAPAPQYNEAPAPVQNMAMSRGRKISSTGGNRSWSEEEVQPSSSHTETVS